MIVMAMAWLLISRIDGDGDEVIMEMAMVMVMTI